MDGSFFSDSAVLTNGPELWNGFLLTLQFSVIGMIGSIVVGIVGASILALHVPVLRQITYAYVEFIRGTPLLVQIFFLFFALPELGVTLDGYAVACLSLIIWGGAYNVENFRAGFSSVDGKYHEGAAALGFSDLGSFANIALPIGVRLALPGLTNTLISVLKNSGLMLGIGVMELTATTQKIAAETFRVIELFIFLGVVYLVVVLILSRGLRLVSQKFALKAGV